MYECLPPWTVNRSVIQRSPVFRSAPARSKNYLPFGEFFAAGNLVVVCFNQAKDSRKHPHAISRLLAASMGATRGPSRAILIACCLALCTVGGFAFPRRFGHSTVHVANTGIVVFG